MTSIEKTTFKSQTVISILSALAIGLSTYFSQKQGLKDAIQELKYEINLKTNDLQNEDKLIRKDVSDQGKRIDYIEAAAMSYLKPDEIKTKNYR